MVVIEKMECPLMKWGKLLFSYYHGTSVGWNLMTKERQFPQSLCVDFRKRWDKCKKQQFIYLSGTSSNISYHGLFERKEDIFNFDQSHS